MKIIIKSYDNTFLTMSTYVYENMNRVRRAESKNVNGPKIKRDENQRAENKKVQI